MNSLAKACVATSARGCVEEHLGRWTEHPRIDIGIAIVIRRVGRGSAYAMMSGHLGACNTHDFKIPKWEAFAWRVFE